MCVGEPTAVAKKKANKKQKEKTKAKALKENLHNHCRPFAREGRGKGQTKSDLLNRMYQYAVDNPTSSLAVFVAHLPPHEFFAEAALVSSPKGEPAHAGWDFFAVAVFLSIFLLGMVVGIILCLTVQWISRLVEKLQCAVAADSIDPQFKVTIACPWDIMLTPEGDKYHTDKNCWGIGKARSKKQIPACKLCAMKVK
jgi:hypothetical protein